MEKAKHVLYEPEMTPFESAFLLDLLRKEQPSKVLEIGVAAGGTTAMMLETLLEIHGAASEEWKMFSVDKSKQWYRDPAYRTGFMADNVIEEHHIAHHQFLLGDVLPAFLPKIGDGIDFVVLDTMHSLPGELLDFLCVLPYLKDNAVVCLHDVNLHHSAFKNPEWIATNVLLHSVVAEHILPMMKDDLFQKRFANIGAFRITKETRSNIRNIFLALTMPWAYLPGSKDLLSYSGFIKKHYDAPLFDIYQETLLDQDACHGSLKDEYLLSDSKIMIYGAGSCGRRYYEYLRNPELHNEVVLVDQNADAWNEVFEYDMEKPSDVRWETFDAILISIENFRIANQVYQEILTKTDALSKVRHIF